jgi:hypothetical protein
MPLTDEQRTMLQLLLGGQSYEDIGGLLGVSADEVRVRARGALTEMGGADPDSGAGLTDFLLGKADPIGRADAVRQLQNDAAANDLATRLVSQLRLLAPAAQFPEIPAARGGRRAQGPPPPAPVPPTPDTPSAPPPAGAPPPSTSPPSAARGGEPLPGRLIGGAKGLGSRIGGDSRLLFGLGAVGLLAIAVVVALTVFGGDGDEGSSSSTTPTSNEELTIVELAPLAGGSEATGQAVFARAGDQPVLQINLAGLTPTAKDENYIVWLYNTDSLAFPLARDQVDDTGNLTGAAPVPNAIVPLLPQFGCIDVSLASVAETKAALKEAVGGRSLPHHAGKSVLRGQIPRQGQETATGADSNCTAAAEAASGGGATTPTTP